MIYFNVNRRNGATIKKRRENIYHFTLSVPLSWLGECLSWWKSKGGVYLEMGKKQTNSYI